MQLEKVSKKLSFLLRHCQEPLYIDLNGGWAKVGTILETLRSQYPEVNRKVLD